MDNQEQNNQFVEQFKGLKKFPFVTAGISLIFMIAYCILPRGFGVTLNTFLLPAFAVSFILLGIYMLRNLQGKVKFIGIGAIVFGVIAYPLVTVLKTGGGLFPVLHMTIRQFNPFINGTPFGILTLLEFVTSGFVVGESYAFVLPSAISITFYVGVLLYLFFPAGKVLKDNKEIAEKDSPLRFYVCMFSAITAVLVILALVIWGVFALIGKMLDGGESGSSSASVQTSEGVEQLVIVDGVNAVCFEIRDRGEIYNVRTSNEFVGYLRDTRILDEKNNEIAFVGTNDEICFYDKGKKGKLDGFGALYVKIFVK